MRDLPLPREEYATSHPVNAWEKGMPLDVKYREPSERLTQAKLYPQLSKAEQEKRLLP